MTRAPRERDEAPALDHITQSEWRVLAILMGADIMAGTSDVMVLPGLAHWLQIYHQPSHIGWIVSAYLLVAAAAAALLGPVGDIFGRKTVLLWTVLTVMLGCVISACATNLGMLVAGRAVQGVAGAILPLTFGIVRELLQPSTVFKAVGLIVAATATAAAIGLVGAGFIVDHFGPHAIFIVLAGLAAISAGFITLGLPPSKKSPLTRIDWLGGMLFAPGVAALLLGLGLGRSSGWSDPSTLWAFATGSGLLVFWVWHENRAGTPLIDIRLLGNRRIMLANIAMACTAAGSMEVSEILSILARQPAWTGAGFELSATMVGIVIFPSLALASIASIWAGWAGARRGPTLPMVAGALCMVGAGATGLLGSQSFVQLILAAVLSGAGGAAIFTGIAVVIMSEVPPDRTSEATGFVAVVRAVFQGAGSQLIAILLSVWVVVSPSGTHFPAAGAYAMAFTYVAILSVVALVLSVTLRWASGGWAHAWPTEVALK